MKDENKENLHSEFKQMKKELGLNNADVAQITGLSVDSVKTMTQPSKELPSWAKAMIYVWKHFAK